MAVPTGRCNKRIRREVEVELVRPDASEINETAIAENVSARGMHVATEHIWRPGDRVVVALRNLTPILWHASFIVSAWKTTSVLSVWNFCSHWDRGPSPISS